MTLDKDQVVELIAHFHNGTGGKGVCEILAAMSCVLTDVLSNSANTRDEAMTMFSMVVTSVGMDMQKRVDDGQCGWQHRKQ